MHVNRWPIGRHRADTWRVARRYLMLRGIAPFNEVGTHDWASPFQLALLDQHLPVKLREQVHETKQAQLGDDEVATEIPAFKFGLGIDECGSEPPKMSPDGITDRTTRKECDTDDAEWQPRKSICDEEKV